MSKTIKVEDKVYEELDRMRVKGQTFSQVISDLISIRVTIFEVIETMMRLVNYHEWKEKLFQELQEAIARRDSSQVPKL